MSLWKTVAKCYYSLTPCCKHLLRNPSGEKNIRCPFGEDILAWILYVPLFCMAFQKKNMRSSLKSTCSLWGKIVIKITTERTYYGSGTILDALHILTHLILMYEYLTIRQVRNTDKIDSSRLTLPLSSFWLFIYLCLSLFLSLSLSNLYFNLPTYLSIYLPSIHLANLSIGNPHFE